MTPNQQTQNLISDFSLFDNWEDKYRYLIDLGDTLAPLTTQEHNQSHKVEGCVSQVWLVCKQHNHKLIFRGDSDAHIVRGLIAILILLYSNKTPKDILALDAKPIFERLGLSDHLIPQRSNGFYSMVARIKCEARDCLGGAKP